MHYFSKNPKSKHNILILEDIIRGKKLIFKTDSGIFSPKKIDKGTKLLLESLDLNKNMDLLDVGCGYGVIGIGACDEVKSVIMTDINKRAVKLAKENIKLNNLNDKDITVLNGDLYEKIGDKKFDIIVSNPPIRAGRDVIHKLITEGKKYLKNNGSMYLVIQTKHGAKSLGDFLDKTFGNVETVKIKGGYRVLKSIKREKLC